MLVKGQLRWSTKSTAGCGLFHLVPAPEHIRYVEPGRLLIIIDDREARDPAKLDPQVTCLLGSTLVRVQVEVLLERTIRW